MALFKTRNRRSSSPSYVSTLVTLGFIALCIFGVWMLNSNSRLSSQPEEEESTATTARTAVDTSETRNNDFSTSDETTTAKNTEETVETRTVVPKIEEQKETPTAVYGDNPGHLPEDAIKSDDKNINNDQNKQQSAVRDSQISEESSIMQKEQVSVIQESNLQNDEKASEENKKEEEENTKPQDVTESNDANAAESQEQSTGQQSFDTQGSKNDEDEANKEQLREDKGENEEKQSSLSSKVKQSEGEETVKPKARKGRNSKKTWSTQVDQSQIEKKRQKGDESGGSEEKQQDYKWSLCNVTAGADYIPCLDNEKAIKMLHSTKHFEHRERHCPEDAPTCLVPLPEGYKTPIRWPNSRDKVILIERHI